MFLYLEESGDPNIGVCLQEVLQLELKVRKTQRYIRPFFAIASKIMSVKFVLNTYTRSLFRGRYLDSGFIVRSYDFFLLNSTNQVNNFCLKISNGSGKHGFENIFWQLWFKSQSKAKLANQSTLCVYTMARLTQSTLKKW